MFRLFTLTKICRDQKAFVFKLNWQWHDLSNSKFTQLCSIMTRSHDLPPDPAGHRSRVKTEQIFCNLQRFNHHQCTHLFRYHQDINTVQPSTKNHAEPNTTSLVSTAQNKTKLILQDLISKNKKNRCFHKWCAKSSSLLVNWRWEGGQLTYSSRETVINFHVQLWQTVSLQNHRFSSLMTKQMLMQYSIELRLNLP